MDVRAQDTTHVALATDANYIVPTTVAVQSLAEHLAPGERVVVHLVNDGLTARQLAAVECALDGRGTLEPVTVDPRRLHDIAVRNPHGYPPATYFRLLLPELLPTVDRVVYLDGDVLVQRSVHSLDQVDLHGATAAAVAHFLPAERTLGTRPGVPYVNTGVLIMDLAAWRQRRLGEEMLALLSESSERCPFADQDAINELLGPEIHHLDPRWNQLSSLVLGEPDDGLHDAAALARLRHDPWIIHFSSQPKPWQRGGASHPHAALWQHYHSHTEWGVHGLNGRDRMRTFVSKGAFRLHRLRSKHQRSAA